ncbi:hypothetical protein [Candidatus Reidiella endopervernicosa]|uniref:Uncharacterized protein n=1 Tax=Candidatus Reidiella endopervernicosa TaxID=2738883 RepID=A0A6N0HWN5_9GAMM|nr:hypothetical protein [Candidatus Reidiella endopervernicosa]QKQ26778.1 hypothetical protein HUE57_11140 [Candidatus Reidiella endopervernicosa]
MPAAPRPSCVRCVITSSRLYTTPSVTLRRHKAAAASSPSFARASTTNRQTASTIGTNRPHFALHGGQRRCWSMRVNLSSPQKMRIGANTPPCCT